MLQTGLLCFLSLSCSRGVADHTSRQRTVVDASGYVLLVGNRHLHFYDRLDAPGMSFGSTGVPTQEQVDRIAEHIRQPCAALLFRARLTGTVKPLSNNEPAVFPSRFTYVGSATEEEKARFQTSFSSPALKGNVICV
jgi:hypothetical protein